MTKTLWMRLALFVAVAWLVPAGALGADPPPLVVIVHPSNPSSVLERKFVADAFLKKATRWSDEKVIKPVDGHRNSAVRQRFSEDVLRRSVEAVKAYWQQIVFSGRGVPPPELDTDADIVSYVLRNSGAIGYVSGGADLRGAKIVQVR